MYSEGQINLEPYDSEYKKTMTSKDSNWLTLHYSTNSKAKTSYKLATCLNKS